jgi:hypothetical protein
VQVGFLEVEPAGAGSLRRDLRDELSLTGVALKFRVLAITFTCERFEDAREKMNTGTTVRI